MEKTAWIIILLLNLAGILFMIGMSAGKLIKNHMARFKIVDEEELFDLRDMAESEKEADMTGNEKEATASPEKEKAPAGKPTFDIDDFDFDL